MHYLALLNSSIEALLLKHDFQICDLKPNQCARAGLLLFVLLGFGDLQAGPPNLRSIHLRDAAKFSLEMDNDIYYGSDNQFSNGWNFRMQSSRVSDWQQLKKTPHWAMQFPTLFNLLHSTNLSKRLSFSVGQVINTPANVASLKLVEDDVPYVGLLAGQLSWSAFNNSEMHSIGLTVGMTGRSSMAEQSQNIIHRLTGSELAQGWGHQVRDELALNVNVLDKRKVYERPLYKSSAWDVSLSRGAAVGTIFTYLAAGVELRIGDNLPGGFAPIPNIMGRGVAFDASLPPKQANIPSYYASLNANAHYFLHHLFLQGSVFSARHGKFVEREPLIGSLNLGLHYETPDWGAHLNWVISTDTIKVDALYNNEDKRDRYLSFTFEWKLEQP